MLRIVFAYLRHSSVFTPLLRGLSLRVPAGNASSDECHIYQFHHDSPVFVIGG
jgi:hypothetical protein